MPDRGAPNMSTDPNITDRRQELGYHHLPEGFKDAADENGNISLNVRVSAPRLDALGRPLGPVVVPDEVGPFLERTKVKTKGLPTYSGGSAIAYIAEIAGLTSIKKAVTKAAAAEQAWDNAEATLREAQDDLKAFQRGALTDAAIEMNKGGTFTLTNDLIKEHRQRADRVATLEGVLGPTDSRGHHLKARPQFVSTAIISDAVASLKFDEIADLMYANMIVGAHQAARHHAGAPPAPLPVNTAEVSNMVMGRLPYMPSWTRDNPDERGRLANLRRQLGPVVEEIRREVTAEVRGRMAAAA